MAALLALVALLNGGCAHEAGGPGSAPTLLQVSLEVERADCDGSRATRTASASKLEKGPVYRWLAKGRLEVDALYRESGGDSARPRTARATLKGNLITLILDYGRDAEGSPLPSPCVSSTPHRFVVDAIEDRAYLVIVARETEGGFFRALWTVWVDEPPW